MARCLLHRSVLCASTADRLATDWAKLRETTHPWDSVTVALTSMFPPKCQIPHRGFLYAVEGMLNTA